MIFKKRNALRNWVLLTRLIRINSIANTVKTIIININLIYISPLWVHLTKKVGIRSPTNKNEFTRFIKEEKGKNT